MLALRRKPPFDIGVPEPAWLRPPSPFVSAILAWRARARQRWELSQMSARDFADLGVPPSLAAQEARRWPWRGWDSQWREIEKARGGAAQTDPPEAPARSGAAGAAILLTLAAAGLTIFLWALNPITTRIATAQLTGLAVGVFRPVGAGLLAVPLLAIFRLRPPRDRGGWTLLLLSAGGGFIGFPLLLSLGTARTSPCHAALIMAAMGLFAVLIDRAVERRIPRLQWCIGAAIALAGEAMLIGIHTGHIAGHVRASMFGDVLVLGGCLAAAASFVAGARLTTRIGAWAATFWAIALAGIGLLPIAAVMAGGSDWTALSLIDWVALLHLAFGAGLVAWIAWFWALSRGGIAQVGVLQLAQPLMSLVLAVLLLSERLTAPMIVAAIAILAGVAFARRGEAGQQAARAVAAE